MQTYIGQVRSSAKRRLYSDTLEDMKQGRHKSLRTQTKLKYNEDIFYKEDEGELHECRRKPRLFWAANEQKTLVTSIVGKILEHFIKEMNYTVVKKCQRKSYAHLGNLHAEYKDTANDYLRMTCAIGMNGKDLSDWFNKSLLDLTISDAFIFLGDDGLLLIRYDGKLYAIELDYSQFESCQGPHYLNVEFYVIRKLGEITGWVEDAEKLIKIMKNTAADTKILKIFRDVVFKYKAYIKRHPIVTGKHIKFNI